MVNVLSYGCVLVFLGVFSVSCNRNTLLRETVRHETLSGLVDDTLVLHSSPNPNGYAGVVLQRTGESEEEFSFEGLQQGLLLFRFNASTHLRTGAPVFSNQIDTVRGYLAEASSNSAGIFTVVVGRGSMSSFLSDAVVMEHFKTLGAPARMQTMNASETFVFLGSSQLGDENAFLRVSNKDISAQLTLRDAYFQGSSTPPVVPALLSSKGIKIENGLVSLSGEGDSQLLTTKDKVVFDSIRISSNAVINGNGAFGGLLSAGTLRVTGSGEIGSLSVSEKGSLGSLEVFGNSVLNGGVTTSSLSVSGNGSLWGSLNVSGSSVLKGVDASSLTVSGNSFLGTLNVLGGSVLNSTSASSLTVSGNGSLGSLNVSGSSVLRGSVTAPSLTVSGNGSLGSLDVFGNSVVGGSVIASSLSVSGNGSLRSLNVSGDSVLSGDVSASSLTTSGDIRSSRGRVRDRTGDVMPVGSVTAFMGVRIPDGWLLCNGQIVSRSSYHMRRKTPSFNYGDIRRNAEGVFSFLLFCISIDVTYGSAH